MCARDALDAAAYINIAFRQVRIEPAKCQRKLVVKQSIPATALEDELSGSMLAMRDTLLPYVHGDEQALRLTVYKGRESIEQGILITAILKFTESSDADRAYAEIPVLKSTWQVGWLTADRESATGIRQSGLVHLVPAKLGPSAYYSIPLWLPPPPLPSTYYQSPTHSPTSITTSQTSAISMQSLRPQIPASPPAFEELLLLDADDSELNSLCREFEDVVSIKSDGAEREMQERILQATVFAGRLNSQKIGLEAVKEHFAQFGPIRYLCLFNRGALSPEGGIFIELYFLT